MFCFSLREQIDCERQVCLNYFVAACARFVLEQYETTLQNFYDEFIKLTLADEKNDYLHNFLQELYGLMERDGVWQGMYLARVVEIKIFDLIF